MNKHYKRFIDTYIEPKKQIILDRKNLFGGVIPDKKLSRFITERYEQIRHLCLIGYDELSEKIIAIFIEELLIYMNIAMEMKYSDEYKGIHLKYEGKGSAFLYQRLKSLGVLSEKSIDFLERYFSPNKIEKPNKGQNLRNISVHNKEMHKLKGKPLYGKSDDGNIRKYEPWIEEWLKSDIDFVRTINSGELHERIPSEFIMLTNFINENIFLLWYAHGWTAKSDILKSEIKDKAKYVSDRWLYSYNEKTYKKMAPLIEFALKNPLMKSDVIYDDDEKMYKLYMEFSTPYIHFNVDSLITLGGMHEKDSFSPFDDWPISTKYYSENK